MNQNEIVKPLTIKRIEEKGATFFVNEQKITDFDSSMFIPGFWQSQDAVEGTAKGRGLTYFVRHHDMPLVLKHYYRGGAIGKLVQDKYLFLGLENTRAFKEFYLLLNLSELSLPIPMPVACKIERQGLFYRADMLTERVENAIDLVGYLTKQALPESSWRQIGETIALFHQHNVFHADLNCHNILLDETKKVWLIDFDQGEIKRNDGQWKQDNLARLKRSFVKELSRLPVFHWQESNWQALISGYKKV